MNPQREYSYIDAGFDSFLSRSIDNLSQVNLDSQGPVSTQFRADSAVVSGSFGDTLRLGNIKLNGVPGNIVINDGNNDFLLMGVDE